MPFPSYYICHKSRSTVRTLLSYGTVTYWIMSRNISVNWVRIHCNRFAATTQVSVVSLVAMEFFHQRTWKITVQIFVIGVRHHILKKPQNYEDVLLGIKFVLNFYVLAKIGTPVSFRKHNKEAIIIFFINRNRTQWMNNWFDWYHNKWHVELTSYGYGNYEVFD